MADILKPNQVVHTASGINCNVEKFLGSGGQGEVYKVSIGGQDYALKWYYSHIAIPEQEKNLENIIKISAPNEKFLWPIEIVRADHVPYFGYYMALRDIRYKSINDLMARRTTPSLSAITTACMYLADSFFQLHSKGLCYRDISFGNVFFNPENGDVLICDNDNVTFDGQNEGGILGTPRFMAPEIVVGTAKPSSHTDRFSLAVLLFYMLFTAHPLEGQLEAKIHSLDPAAMTKLYGKEPVFIFDPQNTSNRPVSGIHDNALVFWNIYPQFLKDLFVQAFTEGLFDPDHRVMETIWRLTMAQLHDSIYYCSCGAENFYNVEKMMMTGGIPGECWSCHQTLKLPFRMRIGKGIVMLNYNTKLYPYHIMPGASFEYNTPVAVVNQNPRDPAIWGLQNLTKDNWVITLTNGTSKDVPPGRSFALSSGIKINFGKTEGEIKS